MKRVVGWRVEGVLRMRGVSFTGGVQPVQCERMKGFLQLSGSVRFCRRDADSAAAALQLIFKREEGSSSSRRRRRSAHH